MNSTQDELLALTSQLLDAISKADWEKYTALCSSDLTCFEPEAKGFRVHGLAFHQHYFDSPASAGCQTTLVNPHVRFCGQEVAIVTYNRLTQNMDEKNEHVTRAFEETRVWQRIGDRWVQVHFHRSVAG